MAIITLKPPTDCLKLPPGKHPVAQEIKHKVVVGKVPGLRLIVRGASRVWEYRFTMPGESEEQYHPLGAYSSTNGVSAAIKARDLVADGVRLGINPKTTRAEDKAARAKLAERQTYRQFVMTLKGGLPTAPRSRAAMIRYGLTILGEAADKHPDQITFTDLKTALEPHWHKRGVVNESVKYISRFLRLAQRHDLITDPFWRNPASLARLVDKNGDLPPLRHRKALDIALLPDLLAALRLVRNDMGNPLTYLIVELIILTALRSNEVIRLRWSYVDRQRMVIAIPRAEMKGDMKGADPEITHFEVPLTQQMIRVIDRAKFLHPPKVDNDPIFPSKTSKKDAFFDDGTVLDVLESLGFRDPSDAPGDRVTIHGFRSLFVGWAKKATRPQLDDDGKPVKINGVTLTEERWSKNTIQMCLAHVEKDETVRAYDRLLPVDPRRGVMQVWNAFCDPKVEALDAHREDRAA